MNQPSDDQNLTANGFAARRMGDLTQHTVMRQGLVALAQKYPCRSAFCLNLEQTREKAWNSFKKPFVVQPNDFAKKAVS
jgi:hypothetical protein